MMTGKGKTGPKPKFCPAIVAKAEKYIENYKPWKTARDGKKRASPPMTRLRLAEYMGIERTTLWDWEQEYKEISNIIKKMIRVNSDIVTENGCLSLYQGAFPIFFAKAQLGWQDKQEIDITSKGRSLFAALRDRHNDDPELIEDEGDSNEND